MSLGVGASPADAAVTIGSNLNDPADFSIQRGSGGFTYSNVQSLFPAASTAPGGYLAPSDGVVVRWRVKVGATTTPAAFRITRPGSSSQRTGAGTSETELPAVNSTSTFETRLPIQAGDAIALDCCAGSAMTAFSSVYAPETFWVPMLADGEPPRLGGNFYDNELLLNADIEPDADADGFGDETQDECPTDASAQNECVPPETTITKAPNDKTRRKRATFEFASNELGSAFECTLDGKSTFKPCTSPLTVKVKRGKHTFQVQATDQAGNADGSPATDDWKVRKKKKD